MVTQPNQISSDPTILPDANMTMLEISRKIERAIALIATGSFLPALSLITDENFINSTGFEYNRGMSVVKTLKELGEDQENVLAELKSRFRCLGSAGPNRKNYGQIWVSDIVVTRSLFKGMEKTINKEEVPQRYQKEMALLALRILIQMFLILKYLTQESKGYEAEAVREMINRSVPLTRSMYDPYLEALKSNPPQREPIFTD